MLALEIAWRYVRARNAKERKFARIITGFRNTREGLREGNVRTLPLERWQYVATSEQLGCSEEDVERTINEWMYRRPLRWLKFCRRSGIIECLDGLSRAGLRLGVFSDYPAEEKLEALGVRQCFDLVLSAIDDEIDAFKPHPRGFLEAARRWELTPAEIIYVGDRLDVDAAGARAAGMGCIVIGQRRSLDCDGVASISGFEQLRSVIDANCYV
jgi:HAD superfamily hydrolase (TIGR01549 family)